MIANLIYFNLLFQHLNRTQWSNLHFVTLALRGTFLALRRQWLCFYTRTEISLDAAFFQIFWLVTVVYLQHTYTITDLSKSL